MAPLLLVTCGLSSVSVYGSQDDAPNSPVHRKLNQLNPTKVNLGVSGGPSTIIPLPSGNLVAFSGKNGTEPGIFAQLYDRDNFLRGENFQISKTIRYPTPISANPFPDGGAIVIWNDLLPNGNSTILGRFLNYKGNPIKDFSINPSINVRNQSYLTVKALRNGRFIIAWEADDSSGNGVYAQLFNRNGTSFTSAFPVNTYTTSDQSHPSIGIYDDGTFTIYWQSDFGVGHGRYEIRQQSYTSNAQPLGTEINAIIYYQGATSSPADNIEPNIEMNPYGEDILVYANNLAPTDNHIDYQTSSDSNLSFVQRIRAYDTHSTDTVHDPLIAISPDGKSGFIIWRQYGSNTSQILGADINLTDPTPFQRIFPIANLTSNSTNLQITSLFDGTHLMSWNDADLNGDQATYALNINQNGDFLPFPLSANPSNTLQNICSNQTQYIYVEKAPLNCTLNNTDRALEKLAPFFTVVYGLIPPSIKDGLLTGGEKLMTDGGGALLSAILIRLYTKRLQKRIDSDGQIYHKKDGHYEGNLIEYQANLSQLLSSFYYFGLKPFQSLDFSIPDICDAYGQFTSFTTLSLLKYFFQDLSSKIFSKSERYKVLERFPQSLLQNTAWGIASLLGTSLITYLLPTNRDDVSYAGELARNSLYWLLGVLMSDFTKNKVFQWNSNFSSFPGSSLINLGINYEGITGKEKYFLNQEEIDKKLKESSPAQALIEISEKIEKDKRRVIKTEHAELNPGSLEKFFDKVENAKAQAIAIETKERKLTNLKPNLSTHITLTKKGADYKPKEHKGFFANLKKKASSMLDKLCTKRKPKKIGETYAPNESQSNLQIVTDLNQVTIIDEPQASIEKESDLTEKLPSHHINPITANVEKPEVEKPKVEKSKDSSSKSFPQRRRIQRITKSGFLFQNS